MDRNGANDVIIKATLRCILINFARRFRRHGFEIFDTGLIEAVCFIYKHTVFSTFTQVCASRQSFYATDRPSEVRSEPTQEKWFKSSNLYI